MNFLLLLLFCLIVLARRSSTMFSRNDKSSHSCLALKLRVTIFRLSQLSVTESKHCGPGKRQLLGWCKSNCSFYIVEIFHLILEYILNKCGHVTHFNVHFSLYVLLLMTLLAVYIYHLRTWKCC